MQNEQKQAELQQKDIQNQRDNQTKVIVAQISAQARANDIEGDGVAPEEYSQEAKDKLAEQIREFDKKLQLEYDKLQVTKDKNSKDAELKQKQINKQRITSNTK